MGIDVTIERAMSDETVDKLGGFHKLEGTLKKKDGTTFGYSSKRSEHKNTLFWEYCKDHDSMPRGAYYMDSRNKKVSKDAMLIGAAKYNKMETEVDAEAFNFAYRQMERHYSFMRGCVPISQDEAIGSLDRTKCAGLPWKWRYKNKGEAFDDPLVISMLEDYYEKLGTGRCWKTMWQYGLKEEMRGIDKMMDNNQRVFCMSPAEHSYALARLCHEMNERMYAAGTSQRTFGRVGLSKFYRGWDALARHLLLVGGKDADQKKMFYVTDMKQFDSSQRALWLRAILKFRQSCLRDKADKLKLEELYNDIINTCLVLGTTWEVIEKMLGNPSGSGNTSTDNTLVAYMLLAYGFYIACKETSRLMSDVEVESAFERYVCAAQYGDDNTFAVAEDFQDVFNVRILQEVLARVGITLTTDSYDPCVIEEATFLGSRFHYDAQTYCYVPAPDGNKLMSSLMWGSRIDFPEWNLYRAYAISREMFYCEEYEFVKNFIFTVERERWNTLGKMTPDQVRQCGMTWNDMKKTFFDDDQVRALYTCRMETRGDEETLSANHHSVLKPTSYTDHEDERNCNSEEDVPEDEEEAEHTEGECVCYTPSL